MCSGSSPVQDYLEVQIIPAICLATKKSCSSVQPPAHVFNTFLLIAVFDQGDPSAAPVAGLDAVFIHQSSCEIDSASGSAQQSLSGERIGQCPGIESLTLVTDRDLNPVPVHGNLYKCLLHWAEPVAVDHCVGRRLVYGKADVV